MNITIMNNESTPDLGWVEGAGRFVSTTEPPFKKDATDEHHYHDRHAHRKPR